MQITLELPEDIAQGMESKWKDLPRAALDRGASYFPLLENFRETLVLETLLEAAEIERQIKGS